MGSSSNESFLWTDASNDSDDNKGSRSMESYYERESESGAGSKQKTLDTSISYNSEIEVQTKPKKAKKRKYSEVTQESSDYSQRETKQVKLEPESDIDNGKKQKSGKDKFACNNGTLDSILFDEKYLNLRVKQEQSLVQTKKKKHKRKNSNTDNACEFDSTMEQNSESYLEMPVKQEQSLVQTRKKKHKRKNSDTDNARESDSTMEQNSESYLEMPVKQEKSLVQTKKKKHKRKNSNTDNARESNSSMEQNSESYLDMRVKQEQASVIKPDIVKSKKKKKLKNSFLRSDVDVANETNSELYLHEDTVKDYSSANSEPTEYSNIEDKFSAEETVVEKPRKKKHKSVIDNDSQNDKTISDMNNTFKVVHENINNNDISLEPNDFTCNNIVSSTFINNSAIDADSRVLNKKKDLLTSKNVNSMKISDRIRFEDDNLSQQEYVIDNTSTNINRFMRAKPQLKLFTPKLTEDCQITNDDEIWMFTWPQEVDIEKFRNTTISFEGKCKIKIDGQTYEGVHYEDQNRMTLVTYQQEQAFVTNLPVQGCIKYHKRIPKVHIPDNNVMVNKQTNFIPLPETKCRHPLFGAHYKKAIKIPTAVAERLRAAKKKHKKKKESVDIKTEKVCKTECEPLRKKKKRKHSQDDNATRTKSKRTKHYVDSPAVWESEKAIEENLFNF